MRQLIIVLMLFFAGVASAETNGSLVTNDGERLQSINESVAKIKASLRKENNQSEKRNTPSETEESPFVMFKGLCICLGVFLIGVGATKQLQSKRLQQLEKTSRLHVIEKVAVTSKTALVLAECDGQKFVFTVGAENVSFCKEAFSKPQLAFAELYQAENSKEERAA